MSTLTAEMVQKKAGEEYDDNPLVRSIPRAQFIKSRLMQMGFEEQAMSMSAATGSDAQFAAEYDANPALYQDMGLTKEAYMQSRRRDEGLEVPPLLPTAQAPELRTVDPRIADLTSDPIAT